MLGAKLAATTHPRIKEHENIREKCDDRNVRRIILRNFETRARGQHGEGHERECDEQKPPPTFVIDEPVGRESEDPIRQPDAEAEP